MRIADLKEGSCSPREIAHVDAIESAPVNKLHIELFGGIIEEVAAEGIDVDDNEPVAPRQREDFADQVRLHARLRRPRLASERHLHLVAVLSVQWSHERVVTNLRARYSTRLEIHLGLDPAAQMMEAEGHGDTGFRGGAVADHCSPLSHGGKSEDWHCPQHEGHLIVKVRASDQIEKS